MMPVKTSLRLLAITAVLGCSLACGGSQGSSSSAPAPEAVYSKETGKLEQLAFDTNKDGRIDTWNFMDGTRLLRSEIDTNHDGVVDRWEYYDEGANLTKVGFSRAGDGKEDAWAFAGRDRKIERIEVSTKRDGTVNRWEYYENEKLVRAEEDTDGDGRIDKWETYADGALTSVALDTQKTGKPDRKLIYGPGGVEVQRLR